MQTPAEEPLAPKARKRGNPAVLPERRARGAREAKSRARTNEVTERAMALAYGGRGREGSAEED